MGRILAILILFSAAVYGQSNPGVLSGNELFDKGAYAAAVTAFQNISPADRSAEVLNRLGVSQHLLNQLKEAEASYHKAIKRDPKFATAYNNLGVLFYSRKNFGEAEKDFRRALEYDPENLAARKNLRASRYARENGRKAREVAVEYEKTKPLLIDERTGETLNAVLLMPESELEEATTHEKRADSFMARKMFEDAIIEYRKAISIDRYNASTVNRLGLAYHQSQNLKDAELNYREAIKLNPYYIEALNNLGTVEYVRKRYDRALDQYNKALKLRPESPTILHNVGACLFAMERFEEGLKVYQYALSIDPQLFDHVAGFGTLIQTANRNESLQNFYLAKVFAGVGDKDRAISLLYKAYESGFKDADKIKAEPAFAELLTDERLQRLIETMTAPPAGVK